jgi:hypothetical protein
MLQNDAGLFLLTSSLQRETGPPCQPAPGGRLHLCLLRAHTCEAGITSLHPHASLLRDVLSSPILQVGILRLLEMACLSPHIWEVAEMRLELRSA